MGVCVHHKDNHKLPQLLWRSQMMSVSIVDLYSAEDSNEKQEYTGSCS